jgi:hypothetical protein
LYSRDRGQPTFPFNCSKNIRLDFAYGVGWPISIGTIIHTSNSIFSILIDSMYEVSLADIMIHKQKGFIVGCGGHGHGRTANFATPAARKSIFGTFVGHLG